MLGGQQVIVERRADISDVERAGRRRCEAGDDGHAGDLGGRPVQCHLPISDRQMGSSRSYVASGTVCPVAQRSSQSRMRRIPVGSGASLRRRAESIRLAALICTPTSWALIRAVDRRASARSPLLTGPYSGRLG